MTTTLVRVPRPRRRGAIPRLPRPGGLQGLARRPIPIDGLARMVRKHIAETVKVFEKRAMGKLERSGLLAGLYRASQEDTDGKRYTKEIVGQMGAPLGEERTRRIQRVLNTKEIEAIGRLFGTEADNWRLELETILKEDYLTLYNAGGRGARLKLRVSGSFNVRNPLILDALAERANLISGISDSVFDRMLTVVAEEGFVFGRSPIEVGKALEDEFSFLGRDRAQLIAHQETLSITEEASHTLFEASGVEYERWLCVTGDTRVSGVGVSHVSRRLHAGTMVKLRTASGRVMTVTGDHQVLTQRGWIPAQSVHQGDKLVSYNPEVEGGSPSRRVPDVDHAPPKIEELFAAAYERAAAKGIVRRVVNFDSEGRYCEIEVVPIDGQLRRDLYPSGTERVGQELFELTDITLGMLFVDGSLPHAVVGHVATNHGGSCGGDATSDDFAAVAMSANYASCGLVADGRASEMKSLDNDGFRAAPLLGELLGREAASVLFSYDRCVDVDVRAGRLHVYDYSTSTGWMIANGVVVHNSTLDGRERPTHFEAHGQIKLIDGVFKVGTAELKYVGDPEAPPEEIMNCRCTSIPILVADQIFSDAKVWDGSNAPDEFSKERLAMEAA